MIPENSVFRHAARLALVDKPKPTTYAGCDVEQLSRMATAICAEAAENGATLIASYHLDDIRERMSHTDWSKTQEKPAAQPKIRPLENAKVPPSGDTVLDVSETAKERRTRLLEALLSSGAICATWEFRPSIELLARFVETGAF